MKNKFTNSTDNYLNNEQELINYFKKFPGEADDLVETLPLFMTNQHFRRLIFHYECYKRILNIPGDIFLFGVRYGRGIATYDNSRSVLEPLNLSRNIIAFDTFEGLKTDSDNDSKIDPGILATPEDYPSYLQKVLDIRSELQPFSHLRKFHIEIGDAPQNLKKLIHEKPETSIALMHLDMNLYEPTKQVLEEALEYITSGGLIIIDEFSHRF